MRIGRFIALMLAATMLALAACRPAPTALTGTVVADETTIVMPALPTPAVRFDLEAERVAIPRTPGTVAVVTSLGSRHRVEQMLVREGDPVSSGQVIATIDPRLLDAAVVVAEAEARAARAQIGVIDARSDEVSENRTDVRGTRREVEATVARLTRTRADLVAKRADVRSAIQRLRSLLPPPGSLPPTATPPPAFAQLAQLEAAARQLDAGIAKIDSGLKSARAGLAKLDSAGATLSDAKDALTSARRLATAGADALDAAVAVSRASRELAVIRAPGDGVVVYAARPGAVLAPGGRLLTVRATGPRRVKTWVSPDAVDAIGEGDRVRVTLDSLPRPLGARVTRVGSAAEFPPTTLATREIHMTRAVAVEVTLDTSAALPPGTPADLFITTE